MPTRRQLLKSLGLGAAATVLPGISFARADTNARLVLVILRGAVDGLALAPPYADGNYRKLRGELAIDAPGSDRGALKLDAMFGLHPSLTGIHQHYRQGEALLVHAVASPYRERSHFDGQDLLENGGQSVGALRDGWLNRAIAPLGGTLGNETAIAMAQNTPLVLRGDNSVTSWAPSQLPETADSTLARLERLYANDEFFATRLAQALDAQNIAGELPGVDGQRRRGNEGQHFQSLMTSAGRFLTAPDGPRIAVVEFGGWDTHANQGSTTGALANRFAALDAGVAALRESLGDGWDSSVVMLVTEFGRTVRVNGTRGTDHGTGTVAMLVGGAVAGGRVVADWPGLADRDLHEGRDLKPTTDLRAVFKGVLSGHLGLEQNYVDREVFPGSTAVRGIEGLVST